MDATDRVAALERSLLTPAVRRDRDRLDAVLHPEFLEIGASGRRWSRAETLDELPGESAAAEVEALDLVVRQLAPDVALVTYSTRRGARLVHRSSIWVRLGDDWTVRFHQGTVAE